MKMDTAAHYATLPAPNRTCISLQTTSSEADALAHMPSLDTQKLARLPTCPASTLRSWRACPHAQPQRWLRGAARASSAQPGLRFSAPVTSHGLLGSSSNKGGVAVLVSVISSAFWDHSPSLAPEAQPIT